MWAYPHKHILRTVCSMKHGSGLQCMPDQGPWSAAVSADHFWQTLLKMLKFSLPGWLVYDGFLKAYYTYFREYISWSTRNSTVVSFDLRSQHMVPLFIMFIFLTSIDLQFFNVFLQTPLFFPLKPLSNTPLVSKTLVALSMISVEMFLLYVKSQGSFLLWTIWLIPSHSTTLSQEDSLTGVTGSHSSCYMTRTLQTLHCLAALL